MHQCYFVVIVVVFVCFCLFVCFFCFVFLDCFCLFCFVLFCFCCCLFLFFVLFCFDFFLFLFSFCFVFRKTWIWKTWVNMNVWKAWMLKLECFFDLGKKKSFTHTDKKKTRPTDPDFFLTLRQTNMFFMP